MDSVTARFNKSDLSEIRSEFLSSLESTQDVPLLPKYVGGSDAHLLIGIKNTCLDPTLIKILPSGVGVYRSAFRDIWGFNLIFAGPHKTFTSANRVDSVNYSIIESCAIARINEGNDNLLMHNRDHSVPVNDRICMEGVPGSGMAVPDIIRIRKPKHSPLPLIDQMLLTDQLKCDFWAQLYNTIVNYRSSSSEDSYRLRQVNDTTLFTFTDLGYSETPVAWEISNITAVRDRNMSIINIRKLTQLGSPILAIIGNESVIYAADEFCINKPQRVAQVTDNV